NHAGTAAAVAAERSLLRSLGGGCQVPLGGHASVHGTQLHLNAVVVTADGSKLVRASVQGAVSEAENLGRQAAEELRRQGAAEIMAGAVYPRPLPPRYHLPWLSTGEAPGGVQNNSNPFRSRRLHRARAHARIRRGWRDRHRHADGSAAVGAARARAFARQFG